MPVGVGNIVAGHLAFPANLTLSGHLCLLFLCLNLAKPTGRSGRRSPIITRAGTGENGVGRRKNQTQRKVLYHKPADFARPEFCFLALFRRFSPHTNSLSE
jgi:hypothetical protein